MGLSLWGTTSLGPRTWGGRRHGEGRAHLLLHSSPLCGSVPSLTSWSCLWGTGSQSLPTQSGMSPASSGLRAAGALSPAAPCRCPSRALPRRPPTGSSLLPAPLNLGVPFNLPGILAFSGLVLGIRAPPSLPPVLFWKALPQSLGSSGTRLRPWVGPSRRGHSVKGTGWAGRHGFPSAS